MFEWSDEHRMMIDAVRQFIDKEIVPYRRELEHGDLPPYELLRKMFSTFGIDAAARVSCERRLDAEEAAQTGPSRTGATDGAITDTSGASTPSGGSDPAMSLIPTIELCRHCPGMVTALGVSVGLTAAAISAKGTLTQRRRWVPDLASLATIGAWAITEPGSGSDAFGSMRSTARCDGDEYILNGSKTFITNGPYADIIVFICKLDDGNPPGERKVLSFVLDKGMAGLEQSKPLRKMGMHSSPTGEIFVDDVRVGRDRLIGETEDVEGGGRAGAKTTFAQERAGWRPWLSASSSRAWRCRSPTPRTASSSASRSVTSSSSRTSWPAWRWPDSMCRTWCTATWR